MITAGITRGTERGRFLLDPLEVSLETRLNGLLKKAEKSKLIKSFVEEFKKGGCASCEEQVVYYIERRSILSPNDPLLSIRIVFVVRSLAVQLVQSLEELLDDGKEVGRQLLVDIDGKRVVNQEGDLFDDESIIKTIWETRGSRKERASRVGLAYGLISYSSWSNDPISVGITVTSSDVIRRIINGSARSLLPAAQVKWFCCSTCGGNLEECEHKPGENYVGKLCTAIPRDVQFLEGSIVASTPDPRSRLTDLLLIENNHSVFEWFALEKTSALDRVGRISEARKDDLVPKEAAEKFRTYFSSRSVGRCRYRTSRIKEPVASHHKVAKA